MKKMCMAKRGAKDMRNFIVMFLNCRQVTPCHSILIVNVSPLFFLHPHTINTLFAVQQTPQFSCHIARLLLQISSPERHNNTKYAKKEYFNKTIAFLSTYSLIRL